MCSVGSASAWKPLLYNPICSAGRQVSNTSSWMRVSVNAQTSESPPHKLNVRHQNGPETEQQKQEEEIPCLNHSTNTGRRNESLWKSASSQESAERHLVLITLLADSRMSPLLFLSLLHQSSSICCFSTPSIFPQHHSLSVFFSFSLPHFLSQFSMARVQDFC